MGLLSEMEFSPWVLVFAQNIAMGLVLILIYNVIRAAISLERPLFRALVIGLLFGLSAVVSMNYPLRTPDGLSVDARTVFVLVGSIFGGPIGAACAGTVATAYRLALGGPGAIVGAATIVFTAGFGAWVARHYGRRVHDLRAYELFIIGFIDTVAISAIVKVGLLLAGRPELPLAPFVAGFAIFPAGTLLLGSAFEMTHQRIWLNARQRLADIVETTSDLVWETDAARRLTFLSDRHLDVLGMRPADFIGQVPEATGAVWIDDATERAAKEAFDNRKPYTNLMKRAAAQDGTTKILLLNGRPIFDERGTFRGYRGTSRDITDVQRLSEELRRSRDGLLRAQKLGRVASGEINLETGALVWSDQTYPLMGFDRTTSPNYELYLSCVHPNDRCIYADWRARNCRGEECAPIEYRFIRPSDGKERWFRSEAELERDGEGRPITLYTMQQDVTERRQAEDALRRSFRTLRMLSDCNQLLIHADDETQLIQEICRTICDTGGYALAWVGRVENDVAKSVIPQAAYCTEGLAAAKAFVDDLHVSWDGDTERGRGPMGRSIRSGEIVVNRDTETESDYRPWRDHLLARGFHSTLTIPLKTGQQVFAALGIYATLPDAFDAAEVELLQELGSDLTFGILGLRTRVARHKAERELGATQDALRAIMDNTVDGLITIDEHGSVLTFSRPAETIFGYGVGEVIGNNVSMLMPLPHSDQHDEYVRRYSATGEARIIGVGREVFGRRKDGSLFPMDLQVEEIPGGASGRRFVATVRDITTRKGTEAQLQQAQKMEAMGQLTGGVAHDFNNLLAVILGRLQLLDQDLADLPQLRESVRACIQALDRGSTLTKSLLAFSRQQALQPALLDLNQVVEDMREILRGALGEAYEFDISKAPDLWVSEADPGQLQNALLNLILNARDAMPTGGSVTITTANTQLDAAYVSSHRDVPAGDYVVLSVSDTGTGMPPEVAARVFEPFFTTKDVGKGSGLGLSMVYGFVKQTGGHVAIYSEPAKGTVVRLYLPRKHGAGLTKVAPLQGSRAGGDETILVVEDNSDLQDLTRIQLERLGYDVIVAGDAEEGLQALQNHSEVALLLSDVILPRGVNGAEVAERALAMRPDLRVVFMSGYNEHHAVIAQALRRHPVRLLQKPFHVDELAAQIRAALD